MLIIDVKDGNIERALKSYKNKVKSVKQIEQLRNRKEFENKNANFPFQASEIDCSSDSVSLNTLVK